MIMITILNSAPFLKSNNAMRCVFSGVGTKFLNVV